MHNIHKAVQNIRNFRQEILQKYQDTPLFQQSLQDVKRVVIINSSSRSGSSLLYALLSKLPQMYSLTGEAAPFYKLNTCLKSFNLFESDKIPSHLMDTVIDYRGLAQDFFSDLYRAGDIAKTKDIDAEEYIDHLLLRFSLQWTDIEFDHSILRNCINTALEQYAARNRHFYTVGFYLQMLEHVVAEYPQINPFYYDISTDKVALRFPSTEIPTGPPNEFFNVEEPPFILQHPRKKAVPDDLAEKTLLLKSTVDCYRMNLLEKIFPHAKIKIIHLTRNPAATTNGIYDGWLHRGFFSHNMQPYFDSSGDVKELRIKGYSDLNCHGSSWWNFDLPEGWQDYAKSDLVEVCAFQWHSANAEILRYLESSNHGSCTIPFEDMVRNLESRTEIFHRILNFMDMAAGSIAALELDNLPVVQSTLPPQLYRWKKRRDIIGRLLHDPKIVDMSVRLGYHTEKFEEWL